MTKPSKRGAKPAGHGLPWRMHPYVVAYATDAVPDDEIFYARNRAEARDFVKTLTKEYKVRVFKLNPTLLYFRAGKSLELEHDIEPTASFV